MNDLVIASYFIIHNTYMYCLYHVNFFRPCVCVDHNQHNQT